MTPPPLLHPDQDTTTQKTNRRRLWGFNAKNSWYIGPCFDQYRSFQGILPSTGAERILDTVRFQHHTIAIPATDARQQNLGSNQVAQRSHSATTSKRRRMDKIKAITPL